MGFRASSKVVTAAALIMSSVFVAFIPGGSATIKPIALGPRGRGVRRRVRRADDARAGRARAARSARRGGCRGWLDRRAARGRRRGRCAAPQGRLRGLGVRARRRRPCWPATSSCTRATRPVAGRGPARPGDHGARSDATLGWPVLAGRERPVGGQLRRGRAAAARAARGGQPGGHDGRPGRDRPPADVEEADGRHGRGWSASRPGSDATYAAPGRGPGRRARLRPRPSGARRAPAVRRGVARPRQRCRGDRARRHRRAPPDDAA